MSTLVRALTVLVVILGVGAGVLLWEIYVDKGGHGDSFSTISKADIEALVRDMPAMQRKAMAENKDQRDKLLNNLKDMMAIASAARKAGFADRPTVKEEFKFIDNAILAISYDTKINKDKGPMPPFGFIGEDRVKAFWGEDKPEGGISWLWNGVSARWQKGEFDKFIETKLTLARERGQLAPGQEPTEEELTRAKDDYARTQISYYDAKAKLATVASMPEGPEKKEWEHFQTVVRLQVQLQKAQLLSAMYSKEVLAKEAEVTPKEIEAYIAKHPELTKNAEKLNTANDILKKVKAGGDMAELAKEYSEDPGSKNTGGLYEGVAKGQFAPEFEAAVSKLKPGEVAPELVKTSFGFHIIKLEKRSEAKGSSGTVQETYDARHILISTMFKDPSDPNAQPVPVEQFVKTKLAKEKNEEVMAKLKAENPVSIPENFVIPPASAEELKKAEEEQAERMKQMQQQQMQQQQMQQQRGPAPQQPSQPAPSN